MPHISFRPITPKDQPFLAHLYATTRDYEMAVIPWSDKEKATFLQSQFEAQHHHYMKHFKKAKFDLILLDDTPIGRLYLDYRQDEIRIIDIAILPQNRRQGLGTKLLTDILNQATAKKIAVRIHVEHYNPALKLYERLGFQHIDDEGVYYLMEWRSS